MLVLEIQYTITTFYELAQMLLGEVPKQFEFVYVIVATVICIAFISVILGFIGFAFNMTKRW